MTATTRTQRTGPVTARALRLLETFSASHPLMTLSELAGRSGLPLTTTHRLAGELTAWGALERDASGRYGIGLRLWEIASLAERGLGLRERALPYLEDLSWVTRENVQLAVRDGTEVVFIERIAGSTSVPVLTRVGGRFAMPPTGVGLVLLAFAPSEVQEQVLAAPLTRFTSHTIVSPSQLRQVLAQVRRQGYAISDRQVASDSVSVAAPVRGPAGEVIASLSIVVRHGGVLPNALVLAVQAAARGASRTYDVTDRSADRS